MPEPKGFASLKAYVDSIQSVTRATFTAKPESKVAHDDAFADMKAHIVKLYDKTEAPHSFMDESGAVYDCIPIEQQPALKGTHESVPKAPDAPPAVPEGSPARG